MQQAINFITNFATPFNVLIAAFKVLLFLLLLTYYNNRLNELIYRGLGLIFIFKRAF